MKFGLFLLICKEKKIGIIRDILMYYPCKAL
nr:MAG TPA: hypothetical protein [Caudoviricetes sp.]